MSDTPYLLRRPGLPVRNNRLCRYAEIEHTRKHARRVLLRLRFSGAVPFIAHTLGVGHRTKPLESCCGRLPHGCVHDDLCCHLVENLCVLGRAKSNASPSLCLGICGGGISFLNASSPGDGALRFVHGFAACHGSVSSVFLDNCQ